MRALLNRRQQQLVAATDRPVTGTLYLRPNGDHWLSLQIGAATLMLHRGQFERVEKLFAEAREEMSADSHRSSDRLHMQPLKLGSF